MILLRRSCRPEASEPGQRSGTYSELCRYRPQWLYRLSRHLLRQLPMAWPFRLPCRLLTRLIWKICTERNSGCRFAGDLNEPLCGELGLAAEIAWNFGGRGPVEQEQGLLAPAGSGRWYLDRPGAR